MWPDSDQSRGRAALRRTLSTLNGAFGGLGLDASRETIGLDWGDHIWVDLVAFHSSLQLCLTHGHSETQACDRCLQPLSDAVELYRGDFLSGFTLRDSAEFDDWQLSQTEAVRRELAGTLESLVECHSARGEFDRAIERARRWVETDPLVERAHRHLMRAYGWAGHRADAQRQYRECVRVLERELGVPPLEETTQLYQAIMEDRAPQAPTEATQGKGITPEPMVAWTQADRGASERGRVYSFPLVGRDAEWTTLLGAYQSVSDDGGLVIIEGEAGIGKTRLANEFLAYAETRGAVTLAGRCYEGEASLPYTVFTSILRGILRNDRLGRLDEIGAELLSELSRLLPELRTLWRDVPPAPFAGQSRHAGAILRSRPGSVARRDRRNRARSAVLGRPPMGRRCLLGTADLYRQKAVGSSHADFAGVARRYCGFG